MNTTFLTAIQARIKTVSALSNKVYFEVAPTTATLPYAVYSYVGSITDFDMENFVLNVDLWGNAPNTTTLEQITKSVSDALNNYSYVSGNTGFILIKSATLMIADPNEAIRRRRLVFEAHTYGN